MQWSPTESDVFASCSVDGNIAIWDTRVGKSALMSFKAHNADVNVISWNRCLNVFSILVFHFNTLSLLFRKTLKFQLLI